MHCVVALLAILFLTATSVLSAEKPEILNEPVVHGAWLYQANCRRCHGPYDKERPGEDYPNQERLEMAVAEKGCRIAWAKTLGGSLTGEEITALARYILAWESRGEEPDLPPLPEIPANTVTEPHPAELLYEAVIPAQKEGRTLSPPLARLVATNPVARGGWLYTENCYRCHLAYGATRHGRGLGGDQLKKIVEKGKTSTQMSGFSVLAGGKLPESEIEAILAYIATWENLSSPPAIAPELLIPPATDPANLRPIGLPQFPGVQGDARKGRELYLITCSRCHSPDRRGYLGPRLLPPWDGMRPDLFLKATIKSGIPGSFMQAFAAASNAKLNPKEIDDIISFLLAELKNGE